MKNKFEQKIFIVDDEELLTKALHRHIENLGYQDITSFQTGVDCIDSLTDNPNIIFLDYQMDEVNGYEVLRKVKRFNPNIHVIMLSSQKDLEAAVETLKYGAFDYIKKGDSELIKIESALNRIYEVEEQLLTPRKSLFAKILPFSL